MPAPAEGELLVRVRAAAVNMADVDYLKGNPPVARLGTGLRRPRNSALGLDLAGVVEAIGGGVTKFSIGDEVFADMTEHGFGAFADYVCAKEQAFAPKPKSLTFEQAAAVPQAAVMALQGLRNKRSIEPGDQVLINGAAGNIGPFAIQIAKAFGAEVTGVDAPAKLDFLLSIGADKVIDYTKTDFAKTGERYHRILDMAPFRPVGVVRSALHARGIYVMVPGTVKQLVRSMFVGPIFSIPSSKKMGMLAWKPFNQDDVRFLTQMIEDGEIVPAIDRVFPFDQLAEALQIQESGLPQGKLVVTM